MRLNTAIKKYRMLLKQQLFKESKAVQKVSLEILREFECLEDRFNFESVVLASRHKAWRARLRRKFLR